MMRNINLVIIVQDTTIQYQVLGVGVIVFMIKRTKRARKVISSFYKNGFEKVKYQIIANCKHLLVCYLLFLDVYVKLEGRWDFESGSSKIHSSLKMAKRFCSNTANCFGLSVYPGYVIYSIDFPIELRQHGYAYNIHKKENILGNFHLSIVF